MSCLLLSECLDEVFENLEDDKITLHSCLFVNRLWCKSSVRILWRNIWNFSTSRYYHHRFEVAILSTLISCLPNESKELLHKNEIFISTPTSKPPLFNYVSFCKALSINEISRIINAVLENNSYAKYATTSLSLLDSNCLITKELLKVFMNQVTTLKTLTYYFDPYNNTNKLSNISFTSFPRARDCLTDLTELYCSSNINYQLSKISHNLQSLTIYFESEISNELKELVSSQNNLKNLKLTACYKGNNWAEIIPALIKHSNTLTNLHLCGHYIDRLPLSFVSSFLNLQEITFDRMQFDDFEDLQYTTFPRLQIIKIPYPCTKTEYLMKFLEINGKNLKEFYTNDEGLNLSVAKFCSTLKNLHLPIGNDENILKNIFNGCQYLESIVILCEKGCGRGIVDEKEMLEIIAKHSPKDFYELKLYESGLLSEDLEPFFISWKNRTSKKIT